jgi:hypothetical protein
MDRLVIHRLGVKRIQAIRHSIIHHLGAKLHQIQAMDRLVIRRSIIHLLGVKLRRIQAMDRLVIRHSIIHLLGAKFRRIQAMDRLVIHRLGVLHQPSSILLELNNIKRFRLVTRRSNGRHRQPTTCSNTLQKYAV